jgi:hypothetical protein
MDPSTPGPEPHWLRSYSHCRDRAMDRFNLNLSLDVYFRLVDGRIPRVVVGTRGKQKLAQFAGIPGTWVVHGRWPVTCWSGRIG